MPELFDVDEPRQPRRVLVPAFQDIPDGRKRRVPDFGTPEERLRAVRRQMAKTPTGTPAYIALAREAEELERQEGQQAPGFGAVLEPPIPRPAPGWEKQGLGPITASSRGAVRAAAETPAGQAIGSFARGRPYEPRPPTFQPKTGAEAVGAMIPSFISPPYVPVEELAREPGWAQVAMALTPVIPGAGATLPEVMAYVRAGQYGVGRGVQRGAGAVGREIVREVTPGPGGLVPGSPGFAKGPKGSKVPKPPSPAAPKVPPISKLEGQESVVEPTLSMKMRAAEKAAAIAKVREANLPPVKEGYVRLYRGERGTFETPSVPPSNAPISETMVGGRWFTTDPEYASFYGPNLKYVDVPKAIAEEAGAGRAATGGNLSIEWSAKAQPVGAPPVRPPPPVSPQPPVGQPPAAPGVSGALMADLQDADELVTTMTNPDAFRKLANLPGVRSVMRVFNPSGVAETASEKAVVARAALREEANNKAIGAFSTLESLGKREKVWGKLDAQLRLGDGPLKGKSLDEVLTYRQKYNSQLTPEQSAWADQFHALEQAKKSLLERNGIEINKLAFDEGGEYVGRRVFGRLDPNTGELVDSAFIAAPGPGRPGAKLGLEKTRVYKDINEALADGFRYLPPDEALYLNIKGAYNRVADKQVADWVMERVPWRSTEIFTLPKASRLVQDALQRMEIAPNRLEALARDMPEVAERLNGILSVEDWPTRYLALRGLKDDLAKMVPSSEAKLFWAVERLTKQRQTAQQGIQAMERALRGETLPTATVNAIERVASDLKGKLREPTRLTLADLVRAGQEAAEFPKTLEVPSPGLLRKYQKLLADAEQALAADPQDVALGKQVRQLKVKVGFTKYRLSLGEPFEFSKSPMNILTSERKKALEEALTILRGEPFETATATGQRVTKFKGGLVKELRLKELEAIKQRKEVAERARTMRFGEASVGAPAFQGRILTGPDAQKTAETLNRAFAAQYGPIENILNATNKVNAIARYFVLAGDMGQFMIQLIAFPMRFPVVTGKAVRGSVKALFDQTAQAAYLAANNDIIQRSRNLILSKGGQTEYTEAFRTIGWMKKKYSPGRLLEPFQRGWEAALDTAGVELRKGFDHLADTPQHTAEIEQFINEVRGVTSSARLGVSAGVREAETAVFLAPRYNRAVAAWATDVVRGGIRGDQARKSLGALIAGWSAIGVAVTLGNGEGWDRVDDHLNPMSPDFMTWDVFGHRVGPGSKMRSVFRLLGRITAEPVKTVDFVADFARANLAFVPGGAIDILTGRNLIGQPTRPGKNVGWGEGALGLTQNVLAENLMPLWIGSALLEGGSLEERVMRAGVEFMGTRAYPASVGSQAASFQWRWKDDLAAYNDLPGTVQEAKAKKVQTRAQYREANPEVDAKLYIAGVVESLEAGEGKSATRSGRQAVVRLMQENKVNPKFVRGLQAKEFESDERKTLRLTILKALGLPISEVLPTSGKAPVFNPQKTVPNFKRPNFKRPVFAQP